MTQQAIFTDGQLAKAIYLRNMSAMKEVLKLGEFKIGARDSEEYKYFKKVVMDQCYTSMLDVFAALERDGMLMKCPCGTGIRQGYKSCSLCNGAGHCNTQSFQDYIADIRFNSQPQQDPYPEDRQPE